MSEDLLTVSDVADLSLALKIYKNIRSRSAQIDDRFVTEPEVKEALNHSCFFNAVEAFTLLGQYEIRRKIKCDDSVTSFKKQSDEERVKLFYQWAHYLFSELSLATGVQTKDALIRLNKIRGWLSNEDQCRIQYAKGRLLFIQNLPEGRANGFNFSPIDVLSRVFSGALTLSLRDKAQIIFNSHRLHDFFLSLDKIFVDGEVSSQFKAQYMPLVRFYLALSGVMASVMYAPHHNSPGDLLREFSSSTHGEFDRCFEFAKLLDDNIQASIQSLLSFFELGLRSPIAKSAFNLLGELYIRFGAKPYAQAIYSDALVQWLSDPMVAHVQLKHLYFLCTNDGFNLDVDRAIQYMGMIGGKNKINVIDHKILDLYACNFIEGSLFHCLLSQF